MYIALITLVISLLGMIIMIGWKLSLIKYGRVTPEETIQNPFLSDVEKMKTISKKNAKKYGFLALFATLRLYILTTHYLKNRILLLAKKAESKLIKSQSSLSEEDEEKGEVNKRLKMISEYVEKIRGTKKRE